MVGLHVHCEHHASARYEWNDHDRFVGSYANDVPNGFGTAINSGEASTGEWT